MKWTDYLSILIVCGALATGIAFYVARTTGAEDATADVTAPMPPVAQADRQKAALSAETIVPVVSADAAVVQDGDAWLLEAPAPSADLAYRLLDPPVGVKALIDGGPSGFTCDWAGLGQAGFGPAQGVVSSSSELEPNALNVTMRCQIPNDVRVVAGLTGTMVLQMDKPTEVQALPVTAVLGSADSGQVVVVHQDGSLELRPVELGVSDIYHVEIVSGLQPEAQVLLYPTQADFSQATAAQ
jgi:hypothetical protein